MSVEIMRDAPTIPEELGITVDTAHELTGEVRDMVKGSKCNSQVIEKIANSDHDRVEKGFMGYMAGCVATDPMALMSLLLDGMDLEEDD